jgi:hypothetical protein
MLKSFKAFIIEAKHKNLYNMSGDDFNDNYGRYKRVKNGIVTHVYDDSNREIATYNHSMENLSTNLTHRGYKNVG